MNTYTNCISYTSNINKVKGDHVNEYDKIVMESIKRAYRSGKGVKVIKAMLSTGMREQLGFGDETTNKIVFAGVYLESLPTVVEVDVPEEFRSSVRLEA